MTLVLDSGALTRLLRPSARTTALLIVLKRDGLWPPRVPTPVLVESLTGRPDRDAATNRLLKTCIVDPWLTTAKARRAAALRHSARRGSAVDAIVVAAAEPGGTVLTQDPTDLMALAAHATGVVIVSV